MACGSQRIRNGWTNGSARTSLIRSRQLSSCAFMFCIHSSSFFIFSPCFILHSEWARGRNLCLDWAAQASLGDGLGGLQEGSRCWWWIEGSFFFDVDFVFDFFSCSFLSLNEEMSDEESGHRCVAWLDDYCAGGDDGSEVREGGGCSR